MSDYNLVYKECELPKKYSQLDNILRRLFSNISRKTLIDFFNSIYGDNISYDSEIIRRNSGVSPKDMNNCKYIRLCTDMSITIQDDYKNYEYEIEFQTVPIGNTAIRLFKYEVEKGASQKNINRQYNTIQLPEPCIILLEKDKRLPRNFEYKIKISKRAEYIYNSRALKFWEYNLEQLKNSNMYMLYPLWVFKLRKFMEDAKNSRKDSRGNRMLMFNTYITFKIVIQETLSAINNAYRQGKINFIDYDEMVTAVENICSYFQKVYGEIINIRKEIGKMVKSL